jgi:predicted dehydrogenase
MITHSPTAVLFEVDERVSSLSPLCAYLRSIPHLQVVVEPRLPHDLSPYDVIVTLETAAYTDNHDHLRQFVQRGGGWVGLVHLSERPLPELFGVQPTPVGPAAELRVIFQNSGHAMAKRLPDAVYLNGRYQCLEKTAEDAEVVLYADWRYQHSPVLVHRTVGEGNVVCTTLQAYDNSVMQQILYRAIRRTAKQPETNRTLGVAILGYSPFVGQDHCVGVEATDGLDLHAACDVSPERLKQAQKDFPKLKVVESADALADDPDIDVVIIATPPNTHAELAIQMMATGKHVLCEKPLALSLNDVEAMVAMADKQQVHLSCHQNRRWDVDYLAIKQALTEGLVGDLFYMETFVGGYAHPCGYWHSHDAVSGGTTFDWGGHYLDWMVSLVPEPVTHVIGTRHKRVWHDVTNADQERIQVRFAGGQEAEFLHSDIAAVRKPKWYLLGTEGAIVGDWRDVTEYEIDPVLYFQRHDIPPTEMVPDLTLHRRHPSGQIVAQKLALPERQHHVLYRNLADHLLTGEPIEAPLDQSVLVVAILEAAARSAARGSSVESLNV